MSNGNSPISQAISRIEDALRPSGYYHRASQAVGWIALARLQSLGKIESIERLVRDGLWDQLTSAGISEETSALMKEMTGSTLAPMEAAIRLCSDLRGAPDTAWDVLPYLTSPEKRQFIVPEVLVSQPVVNLMVDMLGSEKGTVWTPFDPSGQLAITAARRGFSVYTPPIRDLHLQIKGLLRLLESEETKARLIDEIPRNNAGLPEIEVDFILADPPIGMLIKPDEWAQWERSKVNKHDRFDRAETWAIFELQPRAKRRLVALTSQQWLFSTGQERRLREQFLRLPSNTIESVTTLPGGIFSSSNMPAAITSFNHLRAKQNIRVTSLESLGRQGSMEELISANKNVILLDSEDTKYSKVVSVEAVLNTECVLLPQRLLRRAVLSGTNAVSLDEICTVLRPPTPYKGTGDQVLELGIPNLRDGRWNSISYEDDPKPYKTANVKPSNRSIPFLTKDDLLLSIKGTLGLTKLISDFFGRIEGADPSEEWVKAVVSGSCVGLRLDSRAMTLGISPEYLLMYLRSAEGQEQIGALAVGAAVPHINVQSLMSMLRIPVPTVDELKAVNEDYKKLCELEEKIEYLKYQMQDITENRWLVKSA